MKKFIAVIPVVAVVAVLGFGISIPIVNNSYAKKVVKELKAVSLPKDTELVETAYKAGKLAGNGNGMQYFGALLIKSELTPEELDAYYAEYRENEWEYIVEVQKDSEIAAVEHDSLCFDTDISSDEHYYIVYSWGSGNEFFSELDLRGH